MSVLEKEEIALKCLLKLKKAKENGVNQLNVDKTIDEVSNTRGFDGILIKESLLAYKYVEIDGFDFGITDTGLEFLEGKIN